MDEGSTQKLQEIEDKVDAVLKTVEKTRKYYLITMWVTIFFFVAPLIGFVFIIPMFLNNYVGSLDDPSMLDSISQSYKDQLKQALDGL